MPCAFRGVNIIHFWGESCPPDWNVIKQESENCLHNEWKEKKRTQSYSQGHLKSDFCKCTAISVPCTHEVRRLKKKKIKFDILKIHNIPRIHSHPVLPMCNRFNMTKVSENLSSFLHEQPLKTKPSTSCQVPSKSHLWGRASFVPLAQYYVPIRPWANRHRPWVSPQVLPT